SAHLIVADFTLFRTRNTRGCAKREGSSRITRGCRVGYVPRSAPILREPTVNCESRSTDTARKSKYSFAYRILETPTTRQIVDVDNRRIRSGAKEEEEDEVSFSRGSCHHSGTSSAHQSPSFGKETIRRSFVASIES
ncbi:hypothetical protein ALC56_10348, partial [Trachymyrmex septentrionalis]